MAEEGMLGWAAGFLDGEGYFAIYAKGNDPRDFHPRALVRVNQATYREPLGRLQAMFGGGIHEATRRTVTGKTVWGWNWVSCASMRQHLPLLIPYMTTKRAEAELLLRFVMTVRIRGSKEAARPLTEIEWRERYRIADELLALRARR